MIVHLLVSSSVLRDRDERREGELDVLCARGQTRMASGGVGQSWRARSLSLTPPPPFASTSFPLLGSTRPSGLASAAPAPSIVRSKASYKSRSLFGSLGPLLLPSSFLPSPCLSASLVRFHSRSFHITSRAAWSASPPRESYIRPCSDRRRVLWSLLPCLFDRPSSHLDPPALVLTRIRLLQDVTLPAPSASTLSTPAAVSASRLSACCA